MNKAVFLDRDGVINELVYHEEAGIIDSPFNARQFRLRPDSASAIKKLNDAGFLVIVVSNQPGVAKNHFSNRTLQQITRKMETELALGGAHVEKVYYCLHHPEGENHLYRKTCECRKPAPGMLLDGIKEFGLNAQDCYMIGDNLTDVQAGQRAGCKSMLLGKMKCELCQLMDELNIRPDMIVKDLTEAVKIILELEGKNGNLH
jgi:histidinol-phosphate phosphatase family protein